MVGASALPQFIVRHGCRTASAITLAEGAVEIGDVSKTRFERDRADFLTGAPRIGQQAIGAGEPLCQHVVGEGGAFRLEQPLDVARRAVMAGGDGRQRQVVLVDAPGNVLLDRGKPRGAQAAAFRELRSIARRADDHRHQVVNVPGDEVLQPGCTTEHPGASLM
jgi:hypothetical protein